MPFHHKTNMDVLILWEMFCNGQALYGEEDCSRLILNIRTPGKKMDAIVSTAIRKFGA
jgi:hypothetical protein